MVSYQGILRFKPEPQALFFDWPGHRTGMHDKPDDIVTVTPCENGPLLLRGAFTILTQEGRSIDPGRTTVALCRCGRSATKPFCDGSHKAAGFRASSEPETPN